MVFGCAPPPCANARFFDSSLVAFMQRSDFFMHYGVLMGVSLVVLLSLIEWRGRGWGPRYRRVTMESGKQL